MISEKENALKLINFENPAYVGYRVPMSMISYFGCNHEGFAQLEAGSGRKFDEWKDIWGTTWKIRPDFISEMPTDHPLANGWDAYNGYKWPDWNDERITNKIYKDNDNVKSSRENSFKTGFHRDLLWEKSCMLAGMQNIMIWFITDPDLVKQLFRKIMDFQLGIANHYLGCGVEMVKFGDDLGGQNNSLFSHKVFEEFLLPEYRRLFHLYKEKGIPIYFHSCGNIERLLDDFIDLGVNILNPVQATANNLDLVREKTTGKIAIEGGVNSAIVMDGDPEEVKQEAIKRISQLGRQGGYFCCPDQRMPYPKDNIKTLKETIDKFGKFPIDIPYDFV